MTLLPHHADMSRGAEVAFLRALRHFWEKEALPSLFWSDYALYLFRAYIVTPTPPADIPIQATGYADLKRQLRERGIFLQGEEDAVTDLLRDLKAWRENFPSP